MTDQNYLQKVLHERELKQLNKDLDDTNQPYSYHRAIHIRIVEVNYALYLLKLLKQKRYGKKEEKHQRVY
jgi:hypothetical protein